MISVKKIVAKQGIDIEEKHMEVTLLNLIFYTL